MERSRKLLRQDREIALDKTIGDAGGGRGHAVAAGQTRLQARKALLAVGALLFFFPTDNHWESAPGLDRWACQVLPCKAAIRINGFFGRLNDHHRIQSANRLRPPLGYDS